MSDALIWWTDQYACQEIGEGARRRKRWPKYLRDQYDSRFGRNGRGRLWVADHFGDVEVSPWPDTPFANWLGEHFGGIVIDAADLALVEPLPGVVTDFKLVRVPSPKPNDTAV